MTTRSVLVRGVDADTLAAIDAAARRAGKSRQAYLCEALQRLARPTQAAGSMHYTNGVLGQIVLCGVQGCRAPAVATTHEYWGATTGRVIRHYCSVHAPDWAYRPTTSA